MGKGQRNEPPQNAFTRMNFLYQAALLMSDSSTENLLASYYGKLMKDISKKIVEKIHPNVKGTLCKACSFPLIKNCERLDVKLKSQKKKLKKHRTKRQCHNQSKCKKSVSETDMKTKLNSRCEKYQKSRIDVRNKKPNKMSWTCNQCGFSKHMLQRPSYQIWINKKEAFS